MSDPDRLIPLRPIPTEPSVELWDGSLTLPFIYDDGGRRSAGFKGSAGDCVARSVAIASGLNYSDVYAALAAGTGSQRASARNPKRSKSARNGINVQRKWFRNYMESIGFRWTPTMAIGTGCRVHLVSGELPMGRIIVSLSKHYCAVIDGVIRDTSDPQWQTIFNDGVQERIAHRCVYGYWMIGGAK